MKYVVDGLRQFFWFDFFRFQRPLPPSSLSRVKNRVFGSMVLACVGNSGSRHIPSKSNLTTTSPNSVSNLFESKHLYFASENGTTSAVRASLLRGVVYFQTERNTFAWLGLNAYQIVNKLRSSVASCMFQTCKHITPWYDQSLYPYPNTCQKPCFRKHDFFYAQEAGRR